MNLTEYLGEAKGIAEHLQQPAGSAALPNDGPVAEASFTRTLERALGKSSWALEVQAAASIRVFNAPSDSDPSLICGVIPDASDSTDPQPLLQPNADKHAYLKYSVAGIGKAGGKTEHGAAGVSVSGVGSIGAGAYRLTDGGVQVGAAIADQLPSTPLALDAEDVRTLAVGDACYVESGGSLAISLSFDWADLFSGPLLELRQSSLLSEPLLIDLGLSASLTVDATLNDAFRIVFVGENATQVRCVVSRASSDAFGIAARLVGSIAFRDSEQASRVLSGLAAQLVGAPRDQFEAIQGALQGVITRYETAVAALKERIGTAFERLDPHTERLSRLSTSLQTASRLQDLIAEHADDAGALARELDIALEQAQDIVDTLQALPERLQESITTRLDDYLARLDLPSLLQAPLDAVNGLLAHLTRIESAIVSVATRKIELGLTFEYRRLATHGTLFDCLLARQDPRFDDWHAAVLGLDLRPLIDASSAANGITLRRFLHRRSSKRTVALGFSLGGISDRLVGEREWVDVTRILPQPGELSPATQRLVSFKGSRNADFQGHGVGRTFRVELLAEFNGEQRDGEQGHWEFACGLTRSHQADAVSRNWLAEVLDHAALWGTIRESQVASQLATLVEQTAALAGPAKAHTQLLLGRSALANSDFLDRLANADDALLVRALAEALPLGPDWHDMPRRSTLAARRETYSPIVNRLLIESGGVVQFGQLAKWVGRQIGKLGDSELAAMETLMLRNGRPQHKGSVADVARQGNVHAARRQWRELAEIAASLRGLQSADRRTREQIARMIAGLDAGMTMDFPLRWQGRLALLLAEQVPAAANALTCTTTITIGEGDLARSWLLARG